MCCGGVVHLSGYVMPEIVLCVVKELFTCLAM